MAHAGDMEGVAEFDSDSRAVVCSDGEVRREAYEDLPGGSSSSSSWYTGIIRRIEIARKPRQVTA